jgi:hypothetical protein
MPLHRNIVRRRLRAGLFAVPCLWLWSTASWADDCVLPSDWFPNAIPDPQETAATTDFNSFCAFHIWSWNAFLWSMEERDGALRFEAFPTQEETIEASFGASGPPKMLKLQPRAAKTDHPIDSVAQAGTEGLLVAQNKRGVYYSQHITPQMYEQVVSLDWNSAEGLINTPDTALFDVGNIEYKAAWAVVGDGFNVPGAYTRQALIPELATVVIDGVPTIQVPADPVYIEAEVALVGFHVVGWVEGHSEAIWASFSPIGIAPVVPTDSKGTPTIKPSDPVSATATPFYAADTTLADCNQTNLPVQSLNDVTQKFAVVTQACQFYEAGTIGGFTTDNGMAIQQVNASALSEIPDDNIAKGYFEVGAVWSNADAPGVSKLNSTFQDALVGSNVLSNPVIETFTQTEVGQHNCLSCHNSLQFQPSDPNIPPLHASMLNLSHFLMQIYVDTYGAPQ